MNLENLENVISQNSPLGHFTSKPNGLVGHDAVPGQVHEDLDGLVVVDDPLTAHHIAQAVHSVAAAKGIALTWITEMFRNNADVFLMSGIKCYLTRQILSSTFHTGLTYLL